MGEWVKKIEEFHHLWCNSPEKFERMRTNCRNRIKESYNWDTALADILGQKAATLKKRTAIKMVQDKTPDLIWELTLPQKGVA